MSRDNDRFMIRLAKARPDMPDDDIIQAAVSLIGFAREHRHAWDKLGRCEYPYKQKGQQCDTCLTSWDERFYDAGKATCICCVNKDKVREICKNLRVECEFFNDPRTYPIILVMDGVRVPVPLLW